MCIWQCSYSLARESRHCSCCMLMCGWRRGSQEGARAMTGRRSCCRAAADAAVAVVLLLKLRRGRGGPVHARAVAERVAAEVETILDGDGAAAAGGVAAALLPAQLAVARGCEAGGAKGDGVAAASRVCGGSPRPSPRAMSKTLVVMKKTTPRTRPQLAGRAAVPRVLSKETRRG